MLRPRRTLVGMAVALAPMSAVVAPGLVGPAAAITPGVGFTADPLPTYQTNGIAWSVAQAHGVVFVGGTFSAVRPSGAPTGTQETPVSNFVALDAATGSPTGCQLSFTGTGASVRALAVSPDASTLYAGGVFSGVNGSAVQNVAAINLATCTPISTFRPAVSSWVRGLDVGPDGTLYLAGEFSTVSGQSRKRFAAVSPTGSLLPWAPAADLAGYSVAVTPDGSKAAIGGAFDLVNGADSHALAIVDTATGATVRSYPNHFVPVSSTVKSVIADSTGIYTGNEGTGFQMFDGRIALDPTTFNERWRDNCFGATQDVLSDGGNLYAANHAHDCFPMGGFPNGRRQHLTVESINDPHLKVWWPDTNDGLGEGIGPRALTVAPSPNGSRYLLAVGEFTTVNGVAQQSILRLADGPDTGAPPSPALSASTAVAGRVQLRWLASTDRDDENLTYKVFRNNVQVATIAGASDWWRRPQLSYVDTTVAPGTLHVYAVTATDSSGNVSGKPTLGATPASTSSRYAATVLTDGPSLYWRYNGSGNLGDDSTGGNGGILFGTRTPNVTPAALAGDPSTAMSFDGATGYAYQSQPEQAPKTYSIETWFRTTTTAGGKLVGFGQNTTRLSVSTYDRHVYMRDDGRLVFGASSTANTLASPRAYNNGAWHHVVATQGLSGMALYVDGVKVASNTVTTNSVYQGYWRAGGDKLGSWPGPHSSDYFQGALDETAIYRKELTAHRVAMHYRASGRALDDSLPPTAPTGVSATASGSNVALSWKASTDDKAVTGYTVHRSSRSGFTPSTATAIGHPSGTRFTDARRPAGRWYYKVVALDAAGNKSAASAQVSATVAPPPPSPVTQTVTPKADTYVNSGARTRNYGTSTSLTSRGAGVISYLRFALPAAPAGRVLKSATLRIQTTSQSSAGSVDTHSVRRGPTAWTETGLTWANRPAEPSPATVFGTVKGATRVSTRYSTPLTASAIARFAGKSLDLTVRGSGTDSLWFWSRQVTTASQRPTLILVYAAP
jgi:hypothetical protein